MTEHTNAEFLRALADGKEIKARFVEHGKRPGTYEPIQDCSTSALHALIHGPNPGLELTGKWQFKVYAEKPDNECPSCSGTGEGAYDGQSCQRCRGRGWLCIR